MTCYTCQKQLSEAYVIEGANDSYYYCEKHKPKDYDERYQNDEAYFTVLEDE